DAVAREQRSFGTAMILAALEQSAAGPQSDRQRAAPLLVSVEAEVRLPLARRDEVRRDFAQRSDSAERAECGAVLEDGYDALLRHRLRLLDHREARCVRTNAPHQRIDIDAAVDGRDVVGLDPAIRVQCGDAAGDAWIDPEDGGGGHYDALQ